MSLDHMYTYQDLCLRIIHLLTRTYVLGSYVYLPGHMSLDHMYTVLTRAYVLGSYVYLPGLMSLDHMYTYQDLCPWIVCILTRTYVFGSYIYLPGPMSLDHMYTVLTRAYVLGSYVYCTYQDLFPWIIRILTSHVYLPGLLCPWIICILTRTYVLGSHVYFPGLMSLDHTYTYQDLGPSKNNRQTSTRQTHTQTKKMGRGTYRQVEIEVYRCWIQK